MTLFLFTLLLTSPMGTPQDSVPDPADSVCQGRDSIALRSCQDSLALGRESKALRDSALADDGQSVEDARVHGYVGNFVADLSQSTGSAHNWAEALYIAAGVVVIGAAILYLPKLIHDIVTDEGDLPIFREATIRYAHSGQSWDGGGSSFYRQTNLSSARFTIGVRHPTFGLGLTTDAGYIGATLTDGVEPDQVFSKGGPFVLFGPSIRLGGENISLGVDFLNGADFMEEIGWMSEGRFSLRSVVGKRFLVGLYAGALFYDLRFFDGLIWRRGSFNRDLALLAGLEAGLAF